MNLHGYYDIEEIWIPDPILEAQSERILEDMFLKQDKKKIKKNETEYSDDWLNQSKNEITMTSQNYLYSQMQSPMYSPNPFNDKSSYSKMLMNKTKDYSYSEQPSLLNAPSNNQIILNKASQLKISNFLNDVLGIKESNQVLQSNLSNLFDETMLNADKTDYFDKINKTLNQLWQNNGGTNLHIQNIKHQEIINVSKSTRDDKICFDVYVSLQQKPKDRLLIQITKKQDVKMLLLKMKEALEMKYDFLKGLRGLRVKTTQIQREQNNIFPFAEDKKSNIIRNNDSFQIKKNNSKQINQENQIQIQMDMRNSEQLVVQLLKQNDRLYVEMDSQDLWLRLTIFLNSNIEISFKSDLEIKVNCDTQGFNLKKIIQKLSISIWNRLLQEKIGLQQNGSIFYQDQSNDQDEKHDNFKSQKSKILQQFQNQCFILTKIQIFQLEKHADQSSMRDSNSEQMKQDKILKNKYQDQTEIKNKKQKKQIQQFQDENILKQRKQEISDNQKVGDIFSFQKNRVYVECDFETITQYFYKYLQELDRIKNEKFDQPIVKSYIGNNQENVLNLQDNNDEIFLFNLVNTNKQELEQIFYSNKDEISTKIEYIQFLKKQLVQFDNNFMNLNKNQQKKRHSISNDKIQVNLKKSNASMKRQFSHAVDKQNDFYFQAETIIKNDEIDQQLLTSDEKKSKESNQLGEESNQEMNINDEIEKQRFIFDQSMQNQLIRQSETNTAVQRQIKYLSSQIEIFEKCKESLNKRFMYSNKTVETTLLPSINNLSSNTLLQRHIFIQETMKLILKKYFYITEDLNAQKQVKKRQESQDDNPQLIVSNILEELSKIYFQNFKDQENNIQISQYYHPEVVQLSQSGNIIHPSNSVILQKKQLFAEASYSLHRSKKFGTKFNLKINGNLEDNNYSYQNNNKIFKSPENQQENNKSIQQISLENMNKKIGEQIRKISTESHDTQIKSFQDFEDQQDDDPFFQQRKFTVIRKIDQNKANQQNDDEEDLEEQKVEEQLQLIQSKSVLLIQKSKTGIEEENNEEQKENIYENTLKVNQLHFDDDHFDSIDYNYSNTHDRSYVAPEKINPVYTIKPIDLTQCNSDLVARRSPSLTHHVKRNILNDNKQIKIQVQKQNQRNSNIFNIFKQKKNSKQPNKSFYKSQNQNVYSNDSIEKLKTGFESNRKKYNKLNSIENNEPLLNLKNSNDNSAFQTRSLQLSEKDSQIVEINDKVLIKLVPLPALLITFEEFENILDPPIKNFKYSEIYNNTHNQNEKMNKSQKVQNSSNKKKCKKPIIIGSLILLFITIAVSGYLILDHIYFKKIKFF